MDASNKEVSSGDRRHFQEENLEKYIQAGKIAARVREEIKPREEARKAYHELYGLYQDLYWRLKEQFSRIAAFQRHHNPH